MPFRSVLAAIAIFSAEVSFGALTLGSVVGMRSKIDLGSDGGEGKGSEGGEFPAIRRAADLPL